MKPNLVLENHKTRVTVLRVNRCAAVIAKLFGYDKVDLGIREVIGAQGRVLATQYGAFNATVEHA